jgi:hypothetical protein
MLDAGATQESIVAVRRIVRYPDFRLHVAAEPVSNFDEDLRELALRKIDIDVSRPDRFQEFRAGYADELARSA